jgi:hypothetical protein
LNADPDGGLPFRLLGMYATDRDHAGYASSRQIRTDRRLFVIAALGQGSSDSRQIIDLCVLTGQSRPFPSPRNA